MASRYLEPRLERASRTDMTRLQTRRLRAQLAHAASSSPFYKRKLKAAGVKPAAVRSLADLRTLPFTTKDELKEKAEQLKGRAKEALGEGAKQAEGFIAHGAGLSPEGWRVFEVWESQKEATEFFAKHIRPNLPPGVTPRRTYLELHNLLVPRKG